MPAKNNKLSHYHAKRDFGRTPEPGGRIEVATGFRYVVQKHAARQLHYDLRLEMDGVLRSWAVAKGPCLDPKVRRLAMLVEDHPIDYGDFEGIIPKGQYGGGTVMVWDRGTWVPMGNGSADYHAGQIKFRLAGEKLAGGWTLVRTGRDNQWLLIKERDIYARALAEGDILEQAPKSVLSGRSIEQISDAGKAQARAPSRRRTAVQLGRLKGATRAGMPNAPRPQLASPTRHAPEGSDWFHELKYDGYRTIACHEKKTARLLTRNGHDWTERYRSIAQAVEALPCKSAVIDGEICVQSEDGRTSFGALQDALAIGDDTALVYFVFDLLHLDGYDLTAAALADRKLALSALLDRAAGAAQGIQYSEHIVGQGPAFQAEADRLGLEGVISKRADAVYTFGRSTTWRKSKSVKDGSFAIVGYTVTDAAGGLAALHVAEYQDDGLVYVGKVGTGFSKVQAGLLTDRLAPLRCRRPAVAVPKEGRGAGSRWVRPELLAEVSYSSRTGSGALRHAVFQGLREDIDTTGRVDDTVPADPPTRQLVSDHDLAAIWITNPDRVMFGRSGPTKLDLALYYAKVAAWMLPDLVDRPVTLVRCPSGKLKDVFYQRHALSGMSDEVGRIALTAEGKEERADFIYVAGAKGLFALAQFGAVEFHPWGCRIDKPERPDRLIFDLDPDEDLPWREVVDAAFELREMLAALSLRAFVRTTGGKGLHLVVPIRRRTGWPALKTFAHGFVLHAAKVAPRRYVAVSSMARRRGRIFVDYLRNGRGATAVGSYSLRAKAGAPVATPLSWQELADVDDAAQFDYETVPERLNSLAADPWQGIHEAAQTLTKEKLEILTIHK